MIGGAPSSFALPEVLGGLSYALDITEGEPPGHAVRTLAIGMRLAEQLRLGDEVRSALFYALLLKDAGCTANASRPRDDAAGPGALDRPGAGRHRAVPGGGRRARRGARRRARVRGHARDYPRGP